MLGCRLGRQARHALAVAVGVQSDLLVSETEPDAATWRHSVLLALGVTSAGSGSTLLCRMATEEGNDGRARLAGGAVPGPPLPPAGGGLPDARLAHRGRRRRPGSLAATQPQPHRHQRGPQPRRLADHARRAGVPGHAARAHLTARGTPGRAPARPDHQPPGPDRPRATGAAGRGGRAGAAGGPGHTGAGRAAGVRAARHVRRALRPDRPDRGALPGRGQDAGQPGPPPGAGRGAAARDGDFAALVALLDPEVVVRADRAAPAGISVVRGAAAVAEQVLATGGFARLGLAQPALVNGAAGVVLAAEGRLFAVVGFTVRGGKIAEIDILADPARLRRLDLAVPDH